MAVLDKMLEEMAVRIPSSRYRAVLAEHEAGEELGATLSSATGPAMTGAPLPEVALWPLQGDHSLRPRHNSKTQETPLLNAALEFPSAQKYLTRYQDLSLAQALAEKQLETRTTGGRALGIVSDRKPYKKRSNLGIRRARRSNQVCVGHSCGRERGHSVLSLRSLSRSSGGKDAASHCENTTPSPRKLEESPHRRSSREGKHLILSPHMLHSRSGSGASNKETPRSRPVSPDERRGAPELLAPLDSAVTRKSTTETLRAPAANTATTTVAPRRSTLPIRAPVDQPRISLSVEATAPRSGKNRARSATVTGGNDAPVSPPNEASLENHKQRQYRPRRPVVAVNAELDDERYAAVQASLDQVRNLCGGRNVPSVSASVASDEEPNIDARTPSPVTNMSAVRLALAASPSVDPERAGRIRKLSSFNPNPEEVIEPMIVEKRVDFLPDLPSDSTESSAEGNDGLIPHLHVPFKVPTIMTSRVHLRRERQTVQPRMPTPPTTPESSTTPLPAPTKERRQSTGTAPQPGALPPPDFGTANTRISLKTRRMGFGRKRVTTPESVGEDQCSVM